MNGDHRPAPYPSRTGRVEDTVLQLLRCAGRDTVVAETLLCTFRKALQLTLQHRRRLDQNLAGRANSGRMQAYPISTRINAVANDAADCIAPMAETPSISTGAWPAGAEGRDHRAASGGNRGVLSPHC